jgi:hypothetical protein
MSPHTPKNFLAHKSRHLITLNHIKINKTQEDPKKHQKMTIFDPLSETPKNSHF